MYRSALEYERMRDPYQILGTSQSATEEDIKKGFRCLAKKLHPDANTNDPRAAERFAKLSSAHEILGNRDKRQAFDRGEIDADGKPARRRISYAARLGRSCMEVLTIGAVLMLVTTSTLIIGRLTHRGEIDANSGRTDAVLSRPATDEKNAGAGQIARPDRRAPSEPRLILQQNVSYAAGDTIPLGIQISRAAVPVESDGDRVNSDSPANKAIASLAPTEPNTIQRAAEPQLDREQIELLMRRSQELLSEGDVGAARTLLQHAADAGVARAALALGATYDPIMLAILQARGIVADVSLARDWYEKANELGSQEAQERLKLMASALVDDGAPVALRRVAVSRNVEPGTTIKTTATAAASAKPKRRAGPLPTDKQASLYDPKGVYVAGVRFGADADPNIRAQLMRDEAGRQHRSDNVGR
jgi:curved DNA-binding protein CbpA